ncbi:hypothetical protein THF1C08_30143 [Vibrio jasicida]|nr:hypothetical protein THF1C08_30143 [Vibrio jasicida]
MVTRIDSGITYHTTDYLDYIVYSFVITIQNHYILQTSLTHQISA